MSEQQPSRLQIAQAYFDAVKYPPELDGRFLVSRDRPPAEALERLLALPAELQEALAPQIERARLVVAVKQSVSDPLPARTEAEG
jgi:hypothetical protein